MLGCALLIDALAGASVAVIDAVAGLDAQTRQDVWARGPKFSRGQNNSSVVVDKPSGGEASDGDAGDAQPAMLRALGFRSAERLAAQHPSTPSSPATRASVRRQADAATMLASLPLLLTPAARNDAAAVRFLLQRAAEAVRATTTPRTRAAQLPLASVSPSAERLGGGGGDAEGRRQAAASSWTAAALSELVTTLHKMVDKRQEQCHRLRRGPAALAGRHLRSKRYSARCTARRGRRSISRPPSSTRWCT